MASTNESLTAPATKKRARMGTPRPGAPRLETETEIRPGSSAPQLSAEVVTLQDMMQEIRQMREEYAALLRQREAEPQRRELPQLSFFSFNATRDTGARAAAVAEVSRGNFGDARARAAAEVTPGNCARTELGFKLKPDTFDDSTPLREFLSQFLLIARANNWDDASKSVALAASLRGKARTVLESVKNLDNLCFEELKSKLETCFGEGGLSQNFYTQFTGRKQRNGEDLASLGSDLERLSRLAYPECSFSVRDKIVCAQFVSALSDGFLRRTLQLEGVTSLKTAVERAKAIKIIQGNSFERKREYFGKNFENVEGKVGEKKEGEDGKDSAPRGSCRTNQCWSCGETEHFRSECPNYEKN
ncbi:uncharacterized protein [Temnothorax longispinosus]|uniref:uncharacterized protein isoform X1 n=1 Tax=Temnothorax longispinosus TaxID=300112 RepID=UPI003A9A0BF7